MFAAMLFAISSVAVAQFGMYYWRAVLASVASQPVSESVIAAISAENRALRATDFVQCAGIHALTPDLSPRGGGLGLVRFYYGQPSALNMIARVRVPAVAQWIEPE